MKSLWLLVTLFCTGCVAITADPWSWLDTSSKQFWVDVKIEGYNREITYSVPIPNRGIGERPRIWPPLNENETVQEIQVSPKSQGESSLTLGQYIWDRWWGGFLKDSGFDFSLNVRVDRRLTDQSLLDLSLSERLESPWKFRKDIYSSSGSDFNDFADYFFERFWVKAYESEPGYVWVAQNNPGVTADHVNYTIPISSHHLLEFSFFVRDKRFDWKDDPEWNARRWALVEQIMDTVRIVPDPFATDPDNLKNH